MPSPARAKLNFFDFGMVYFDTITIRTTPMMDTSGSVATESFGVIS